MNTTNMTPFEFADDELNAFFTGAATTDPTIDYSAAAAKRSGASNKRPGAFNAASSKSDMIPLPTGVLDRKKRLQRTSPYDTLSSEDDTMSEKSSPRAIDDMFEHDEDVSPAPTSLHEAPLVLGCEEIAIFYSIMTFDLQQLAAIGRPLPGGGVAGYSSPHSQQPKADWSYNEIAELPAEEIRELAYVSAFKMCHNQLRLLPETFW
ncbi:hypothetical protein PybrP1_010798, partial [[Pythium] brassicae (nom. inval.)]